MLSRLMYGARVAVFVAVVPNALALFLALVVGTIAGAYGGWLETGLMRFTETMMVLPTFLLALALLTVLGPGLGVVVGSLVLVSWTYPARVVYGETLRLRETAFVEAARALGAGTPRIIVRHIVPQLGVILLIYFTLNAATMVLLEAGLGFLGFGVQPPTPVLGRHDPPGARRPLLALVDARTGHLPRPAGHGVLPRRHRIAARHGSAPVSGAPLMGRYLLRRVGAIAADPAESWPPSPSP